MESYIQELFAERVGGNNFGKDTAIYKFEKIKRAKRAAIEANPGVALIDMGVGEPDGMAFPEVVKALQEESAKPENRGYADNGISEFKEAATEYLKNVFGVEDIDPETEVIHAIGSKSALAMLPSVLINKDDVVLMTTPGYPVLGTHAEWYGGKTIQLPLKEENNFLPDLNAISEEDKKRAKILYLNYPNNPTGATATIDFYKTAIEFAKKNNIIIVQDAAYAALNHDSKPLSFLSVEGAKDVGIEIHSLSKAYNMTGWRIAFVVGNSLLIKGFAHVKDNYDSGQFIAIQKAGVCALKNPQITEKIKEKYRRRLTMIVGVLKEVGFNASMPGGTFYLYVKSPKGVKNERNFKTAEDFSQYLIREKLISTVPWDDSGNFFRLSATFAAKNEEEERKVVEEIKKRLSDVEFEF